MSRSHKGHIWTYILLVVIFALVHFIIISYERLQFCHSPILVLILVAVLVTSLIEAEKMR